MPLLRPSNPLSEFEAKLLREKTLGIIKSKSFSRGRFRLSSGKQSDFYLDMKPTMLDPEGADALAQMVLDRLKDMRVDRIGGLEVGAIPIVSTIAMRSQQQGTPLPGFFVRKELKNHGTRQLLEGLARGESLEGKNVVILDDVTTSGCSSMAAVKAAQDEGARVMLVLAIVDRQEGAAELYRDNDVPFAALFTASEFMAA